MVQKITLVLMLAFLISHVVVVSGKCEQCEKYLNKFCCQRSLDVYQSDPKKKICCDFPAGNEEIPQEVEETNFRQIEKLPKGHPARDMTYCIMKNGLPKECAVIYLNTKLSAQNSSSVEGEACLVKNNVNPQELSRKLEVACPIPKVSSRLPCGVSCIFSSFLMFLNSICWIMAVKNCWLPKKFMWLLHAWVSIQWSNRVSVMPTNLARIGHSSAE